MISVIVPVYNTGKYIKACLESVVGQTFRDFELILVDDGSADDSPSICDFYAKNDDRIKVIHKLNGGVSSARNAGLELAAGEYVTFIDSDDWVAPDYLAKLNERAEISKTDLVTSGLNWWYSDEKIEVDSLADESMLDFSNESDLVRIISQHHMTSPVSKLYKLSVIRDGNLGFDTNIDFGEDRDFNVRFLDKAGNASTIDYSGYFYRRGLSDSLSVLKLNHSYASELDYWNKLKNLFVSRGFTSLPVRQLLAHRLFFIISDSVVAITRKSNIYASVKGIRRLFGHVADWDFLNANSNLIQAPKVLKTLILSKQALALSLYLKMRQ